MLFSDSYSLKIKEPEKASAQCNACRLYENCNTPKMPITGLGKKGILIVGEFPGKVDDAEGEQFAGKSGDHLRMVLARMGHSLDEDCWKTHAVICRPPGHKPDDNHLLWCRPNLKATIKQLKPRVVILLGSVAVRSLIPSVWGDAAKAITRWVGWKIPCQRPNLWICPTWDPSFILRERDKDRVLDVLWREHLQGAFDLPPRRPWKEVPDYRKGMKAVTDPVKAAFFIDKMADGKTPVVIDLETNMLKPDHPKAAIYSASVCWNGERTISFPWVGPVVSAMEKLVKSPQPKIGANNMFEDRWFIEIFGCPAKNWVFDTMQAGHVLDNRKEITSLSFQSFVRLGLKSYDQHIKPFLDAEGGNDLNRIDEIDLMDLLEYGGLDTRVEWEVALNQIAEFGKTLEEICCGA